MTFKERQLRLELEECKNEFEEFRQQAKEINRKMCLAKRRIKHINKELKELGQ